MRWLIGLGGMLLLAACGGSEPRSEQQQGDDPTPAALTFQGAQAADPRARLAHGERIAAVLGCIGCHGGDLTGEDWSEPGFGRLWTANLTRSVTRYSDAELARVIQTGARPDRELWEMPSHLFTQISSADMAALIAFLRSKAPTGEARPEPVFEEAARREVALGTFKSSRAQVAAEGSAWPPDVGADHALGRYIVRATCAECHGMDLRGGQPHPEAIPRPDLRIAGAYDLDQFRHFLRTGKAAGNRELKMMSGVARGRYSRFTDAELAAVHRYLHKVAEAAP